MAAPVRATRRLEANGDREATRVLNSFRSLVRALRVADRAGVHDHGLGAAQMYVLHELAERSPLSINDLAEITSTDQSSVSVVVNKLVAKGLVASERSSDDARRAALTLTAKGRALHKKLPEPFPRAMLASLERMPKTRVRALAEALTELTRAMGIEEERPPLLLEDSSKR